MVRHDPEGKVELSQTLNPTLLGAIYGICYGALIGLIIGGGILETMIVGVLATLMSALIGSMFDYGINDHFLKEMGKKLKLNNSAVFIPVRNLRHEKLLEEVIGKEGRWIKISLSKETEWLLTGN